MRVYRTDTISIPRDQNLTELLHSCATQNIPESHLIAKDSFSNRSITIGELRTRAGRIAGGLESNIHPPDQARWAIILPNSVEYLEIFHSILWVGGVVCPINWAMKPAEIGHILMVTRPQYIVAYGTMISAVYEAVQVARRDLESVRVQWDRPEILTMISQAPGLKHIPTDFWAPESLEIPHWEDTSTRLASIHRSSGTSGVTKGVELTHFNFIANCYQLLHHDSSQFNSSSRMVGFTPWAHIAMTTIPLFLGPFTGMLHHAMASYDAEEFGRLVESNNATSFQGVPNVVLDLSKTDLTSRYNFTHARSINVASTPFSKDVIDQLISRAPWRMIQVYGMTEAAGYVAYQKYNESIPDGFAGSLLPNMEACLKKEGSSEDAEEGGPGELWLRGPNITRGYAFNIEANQRAFPMEDWYNTGDVCVIDEKMRIKVVGRTKELIKYQGTQVAPAELETYLNSHHLVVESGVGPTWDDGLFTELPTAWVILRDEVCQTKAQILKALKEIHTHVDSQVHDYKRLRGGVWQTYNLPKNPTGKLLKKQMVLMKDGLCSLDRY